jgi:hypothetical protein
LSIGQQGERTEEEILPGFIFPGGKPFAKTSAKILTFRTPVAVSTGNVALCSQLPLADDAPRQRTGERTALTDRGRMSRWHSRTEDGGADSAHRQRTDEQTALTDRGRVSRWRSLTEDG